MEEAYTNVAMAVRGLVSGEEANQAKNQAILRSVLQQRPVTLRFALSALAKSLGDKGAADGQGEVRSKSVGASAAAAEALAAPHTDILTGVRLALEVVLGSSYDPSTPQAVASFIDTLGDDSLEALLHAQGETGPLLPWAARLCLLHACLASGNAGSKRWSWLPTVADSASSLALQELATREGSRGSSNNNSGSGSGRAACNGKGPARASPAARALPGEAGKETAGAGKAKVFPAALMAQVCGELATVGLAGVADSSPGTGFLYRYAGATPGGSGGGGAESGLSSARAADLLPRGHATGSFRLKLQSLREALLPGAESKGRAVEERPIQSAVAAAIGRVGLENLEIRPGSVRRALERGRFGEAFVFSVQAVLKGSIPPGAKSGAVGKNAASLNDRQASVKLKHALEACLFGSGLLAGRGIGRGTGLLDATAASVAERSGSVASSGSTAAAAARTAGGARPSRPVPPEPELHQACAVMQGLVEEGARIRDLLLVLLAMLEDRERERRRPPTILSSLPPSAVTEPSSSSQSSRRSAADVVASLQPETQFRGGALTGVVRAFVGWLADTPWVWGVPEGVSEGVTEGEDWEGDFAAAALAISAAFPTSFSAAVAAAAGMDIDAAPAGGRGSGGIRAGGAPWGSSSGSMDAADVLDRLVASVAAAMGHASGNVVEWTHILQRMAAAATATDSLVAYAVASVEKSAALGGQAPFRMPGRGKRRFAQVGGKELWGLLDGVRVLNGGSLTGEQAPTAVLVRAAAAAVAASRRTSQSWMISPGLLGSAPVRAVIDMLNAAKGQVHASALLAGLLVVERPGDEGPALATDLFAAFVAAGGAPARGGREEEDNGAVGLHSRAVAWLSNALSGSPSTALPTGGSSAGLGPHDSSTSATAAALAQHLIRRVPYEAKPVLRAVEEAAKLAAAGRGVGAGNGAPPPTRLAGKRKHVSWAREVGDGVAAVPTLLRVAREALKSPLLPLPVPVVSPPSRSKEGGRGSGESWSWGAREFSIEIEGGAKKKQAPEEARGGGAGGVGGDGSAMTAGLLLEAFIQSPAAVQRSIRAAMKKRECDIELVTTQRVLRQSLCTAHAPLGQENGAVAAKANGGMGATSQPLSAGLGTRKAAACLLAGYLVESGVEGWEDTKAAMIPPPYQLLEAAQGPAPGTSDTCVAHGEGSRQQQQPLTALRLEVWLRSLLCSAEHSRFEAAFDIEKSFPDVFRTARVLARAVARHASAFVSSVRHSQGRGAPLPGAVYPPCPGGGSGATGLLRLDRVKQEPKDTERLDSPRQALTRRLQGAPAAGALVSWVSSVVRTAQQYRQWLPWQAFADELRELMLVLTSARQHLGGDGEGAAAGGGALEAEAAVFAVCELLLAWGEEGEEVILAVFQPALCAGALNATVAPVTSDLRPPIWLEVLRCLCDSSGWSSLHAEVAAQQEPLAIAAAAAVWIGGDGSGAGRFGERSAREAWTRWYGAKLGSLIPVADGGFGNWLVLSSATGGGLTGGVDVRTGFGGAARTIQPEAWENWGRSPLEAAWNFRGGWDAEGRSGDPDTGADTREVLPAIVLPPFASWLRVVLRGGPSCPEGLLEAYLRRMAREVYLPCQFNGASGEMARQWLGALMEAEAVVDHNGRGRKNDAAMAVAFGFGGVVVKSELGVEAVKTETEPGGEAVKTEAASSESVPRMASARQRVVKEFFREELLRFGSGEAAAAPVGGPLTWLWPLEAVVAACGKAGPFGGGARAHRRSGGEGPEGQPGDPTARVALDAPPSALARALCTVPHDLLCGARRFDRGGGQPPPAISTLRAFAARAVDLTARALATPPCRHWSVARRLLLGLGLLYHALAKPAPKKSLGAAAGAAAARAGEARETSENTRPSGDREAAAALFAIESLVSIALGMGDDGGGGGVGDDSSARVARTTGAAPGSNILLTSACRALRPLETGSCAAADDFAEALRGAGAWRAAAAFFGRRRVRVRVRPAPITQSQAQATALEMQALAAGQTPRLVTSSSSSPPPPPPPLSPQASQKQHQHQHHRLSSPGAVPAEDQPVGGHQANGQWTADVLVGGQQRTTGGHERDADAPQAAVTTCKFPASQQQGAAPRESKKARLSSNSSVERKPPPCPARRTLPMRSSKQGHDRAGS